MNWRTDIENMPQTGKSFLAIIKDRVTPVIMSYGKAKMYDNTHYFVQDHPPYRRESDDHVFNIINPMRVMKWSEIEY